MSATPGQAAPTVLRLDALTGIRGIAAWLVVFYHIRHSMQLLVPQEIIGWFAKGYLAVDLFFVLSGFVLWFNYGERLQGGGRGQVGAFLWRRFARVWPLHAFILSLFVLFAALLVFVGRGSANYPFAELPLHFLLIQNWGFTPALAWNDPAWSISTEFAAYLLFPLLAVSLPWNRLSAPVLIAIAIALCTAIAVLFHLSGTQSLGHDIARLGLWRCLAQFCLGMIACLLWLKWRGKAFAAAWVAVASLSLLVIGQSFSLPETAFVPALFFTAILALALDRSFVSRMLSTRAAIYLGEISYSTYLSHFLLFILFKLAFVDESLQLGWGQTAGYLALVALASMALYHLIEKPAQIWLNGRKPDWATAPRLVAAD